MSSSSKSSTHTTPHTADDRSIAEPLQYLRIDDVCRLLRISKPTLWRLRRSPDVPALTQLSDRAIGCSREEIETWVATRRRRPASTARSRT